jgi:hypothetical protein
MNRIFKWGGGGADLKILPNLVLRKQVFKAVKKTEQSQNKVSMSTGNLFKHLNSHQQPNEEHVPLYQYVNDRVNH